MREDLKRRAGGKYRPPTDPDRERRRQEERAEMRLYAQAEAELAGLDPDQVAAVVDMAVGNAWASAETGEVDRDYFEELVEACIQGIAMP